MTESKKIILYEIEDKKIEISKEDIKKEPTIQLKKRVPAEKEVDIIEKRRELKRWKQFFSNYCLHPEKFNFSFKNLK